MCYIQIKEHNSHLEWHDSIVNELAYNCKLRAQSSSGDSTMVRFTKAQEIDHVYTGKDSKDGKHSVE